MDCYLATKDNVTQVFENLKDAKEFADDKESIQHTKFVKKAVQPPPQPLPYTSSFIDLQTKKPHPDNVAQTHFYTETKVYNNDLIVKIPPGLDVLKSVWIENDDNDLVLEKALFIANDWVIESLDGVCIDLWKQFIHTPVDTYPFTFSRYPDGFPVYACKYNELRLRFTFNKPPNEVKVGIHAHLIPNESKLTDKFVIDYDILMYKNYPLTSDGYCQLDLSGYVAAIFMEMNDKSIPDEVACLFEMSTRFKLNGKSLSTILPRIHNCDYMSDTAMMYSFCKDVKNVTKSGCTDFSKIFSSLKFSKTEATSVNIVILTRKTFIFSGGAIGSQDI